MFDRVLNTTVWKVSVIGVFLDCIFPHSDFIISPYSVRMRKNTDPKNSEYGYFALLKVSVPVLRGITRAF